MIVKKNKKLCNYGKYSYLCNDLLPHLETTYKSIDDVLTSVRLINEFELGQEAPAQLVVN